MRRFGAGMVALIAAGALIGCDRLPGQPLEADRYRRPDEILDLDTLYADNCSGCHGEKGRLGAARPLADPVYLALVDENRIANVVALGVPGTSMPGFARSQGGRLSEEQVQAIARKILARWADPEAQRGESFPAYTEGAARADGIRVGSVRRGGHVYTKFCADCHGSEGRGGKHGGSILDPDFLALVSDQMLRTSVIAGRPDLGMPDWRQASPDRAMTDQEISDVVAWMAAQRRRHE